MWVGDHGLVHIDVIVITEIQECFSCELSAVVDNDRVRDPEMKNDVSDEIYGLLGANFGQGLTSIHLANLSTMTSKWVKPLGAFLKGSRRSRPHTTKYQVMGIVWSPWAVA
jgi:hypothetical protein